MKKFTKKNLTAMIISLALIMSFTSCSTVNNDTSDNNTVNSNATSDSSSKVKTTAVTSNDDMFTGRDKEIGYDDTNSVTLTLADNKTTSSDNSVTIDGNTVTITKEGTYILSGMQTRSLLPRLKAVKTHFPIPKNLSILMRKK